MNAPDNHTPGVRRESEDEPLTTLGADSEDQLSDFYHALRAFRRREIVRLLTVGDEEALSTRELARQIAASEQDVAVKKATGEPYRNAYNALSQTHLPTLADASIIVYDPERQTVRAGSAHAIAALLVAINGPAVRVLENLLDQSESRTEEPTMTD